MTGARRPRKRASRLVESVDQLIEAFHAAPARTEAEQREDQAKADAETAAFANSIDRQRRLIAAFQRTARAHVEAGDHALAIVHANLLPSASDLATPDEQSPLPKPQWNVTINNKYPPGAGGEDLAAPRGRPLLDELTREQIAAFDNRGEKTKAEVAMHLTTIARGDRHMTRRLLDHYRELERSRPKK